MRLWASANRRMEGGMFFCVGMDMMVVVVVVDALHGVGVSFFCCASVRVVASCPVLEGSHAVVLLT